jgi:hypothetical protein
VWWYISVIPELKRLRHENHQFEATVGYIGKLSEKPK